MGSGLRTMPSPPPKGRSSTVRWRSWVKARRSWCGVGEGGGDGALDDSVVEDALGVGAGGGDGAEELGEDGEDVEAHKGRG